MGRFIWSLMMIFGMLACQSTAREEAGKAVQEIAPGGDFDPSTVVRSPVSASEPLDTINVARMQFEASTFDFGEVEEGEMVEHDYTFTNDGRVPLLISSARSTCGCTVPEWPKEAIPPGEQGTIRVRFNTAHKPGRQVKPVTIIANTYPSVNKVYLTGMVAGSASPTPQ